MNNFVLKFSPVLLFLLLFSCSKDREVLEPIANDKPEVLALKGCRACVAPYSAEVIDITTRTALFEWAYEGDAPVCGHYMVVLRNLETGEQVIYDPVSNPAFFDDLYPCTSYSASVSHVSDYCSSTPLTINFTTECYCESTSNNPFFLNLSHILGGGSVLELVDPNSGYVDAVNQAIYLAANQQHTIGISQCTNGSWTGPVYIKLWVDFNKNGLFDSGELLSSSMRNINGTGSLNCTSLALDPFTLPNISTCNLTARMSISPNQNTGPCTTLAIGQVVDFTLHTNPNCN